MRCRLSWQIRPGKGLAQFTHPSKHVWLEHLLCLWHGTDIWSDQAQHTPNRILYLGRQAEDGSRCGLCEGGA